MSFAMKQMYSAKMYFFFFFPMSCQFDREHFNEVFVDLKWFESKVGNKYLNEAAGLAAEKEAASKDARKNEVGTSTENMHCVFQHCFHVCLFPVIDFLKKNICRILLSVWLPGLHQRKSPERKKQQRQQMMKRRRMISLKQSSDSTNAHTT